MDRSKIERNIRLFGAFLLVAGIGLSLWGAFVGGRAWLSNTWPTTTGAVISTTVERKVDSNATAVEEDNVDYAPVIRYTYTVAGETHTAANIRYFADHTFGQRADAEAFVDRYPVNGDVTVYYNPDDAAEALLEPGPDWTTFIPLGFGLFGLLTGLLFVRRPDLL
jgi:hypothetical protein